jgi:hypothetical protein
MHCISPQRISPQSRLILHSQSGWSVCPRLFELAGVQNRGDAQALTWEVYGTRQNSCELHEMCRDWGRAFQKTHHTSPTKSNTKSNRLMPFRDPRVEAGKNPSTVIPASRKRRRKGNPVVSDETVMYGYESSATLTTDRLQYKLQTRPLAREGAPRRRAKQLSGEKKYVHGP